MRVIDLYSIVPIDRTTLLESASATQGRLLTVEDHYAHGGIGDAVLDAVGSEGIRVHKLAVRTIPHSGKPDELIDHYGIGARSIVEGHSPYHQVSGPRSIDALLDRVPSVQHPESAGSSTAVARTVRNPLRQKRLHLSGGRAVRVFPYRQRRHG